MKKSVTVFIGMICTALCVLLLFSTLAFGYLHFTITDPIRFTDGISASIDADILSNEIYKSIDTACATYGLDSTPIKDFIASKDISALASQYFTGYYNAFINGDESLPEFKLDTEGIFDAVNKSCDNATHAELYTSTEVRQMLADELSGLLNGSIASLSYNTLYTKALNFRASYLKLTKYGKNFTASLIAFVCVALLTAAYIIIKKRHTLAYAVSLACLTVSALFAIPMSYISGLDLASRLNVSIGLAHIYINATYDFLITKAAFTYTLISAAILVIFAVAIASKVLSKKR